LINGQFILKEHNYKPWIQSLEKYWLSIFDFLQTKAQRPLLKLKPWPHPYQAALSVRYDIDRTITPGRVTQLVRMQRDLFNAPCASWYIRDCDPDWQPLIPILERHWQEYGRHLSDTGETIANQGITSHSAPCSAYWYGSKGLKEAAERGAVYGEILSSSINTTRPIFFDSDDIRNTLICSPLHFPLEGGTNDKDLSYFDGLRNYFFQRMESGGHVIIGSHPDLNQSLLQQLVEREDFTQIWPVTVIGALERHKEVMSYGNIITVKTSINNEIKLQSKVPASDLQVEYRYEGVVQKINVVQLNKEAGRVMSINNYSKKNEVENI